MIGLPQSWHRQECACCGCKVLFNTALYLCHNWYCVYLNVFLSTGRAFSYMHVSTNILYQLKILLASGRRIPN